MRTLFVYPEFPKTFWSYEKILELVNRKVLLPPLGLVTVAALLPQEWEMKLVDRNVREVTDEEWNWAELVICLLYTSPSPRDATLSRMPSSA